MNDHISRQEALDAFGLSEKTRKWGGDHSGYNTLMLYEIQDVLEALPSAYPKKGKLIKHGAEEGYLNPVYTCSECGGYLGRCISIKFCSNCGADVRKTK